MYEKWRWMSSVKHEAWKRRMNWTRCVNNKACMDQCMGSSNYVKHEMSYEIWDFGDMILLYLYLYLYLYGVVSIERENMTTAMTTAHWHHIPFSSRLSIPCQQHIASHELPQTRNYTFHPFHPEHHIARTDINIIMSQQHLLFHRRYYTSFHPSNIPFCMAQIDSIATSLHISSGYGRYILISSSQQHSIYVLYCNEQISTPLYSISQILTHKASIITNRNITLNPALQQILTLSH